MAPRPKPKRARAKHFFREWREQKFPRQADAEEALGWSQSKVSRLEKGETPYDQDDLERAAEVFGCAPADLISGPPEMKKLSPETTLRSALLGFGVDREDLGRAVSAVRVFVDDLDERSSQGPLEDQSELSSRPHEEEPSR